MGDGGVACVPLRQQHFVMEKLSLSDKSCGGSGSSNGKLENMPIKNIAPKRMKLKRDAFFKKEEPEKKTELVSEKPKSSSNIEVENVVGVDKSQKEEVEEGELGTLKSPVRDMDNGESTSNKSQRAEIENGEIVSHDKWNKDEPEKGEFVPAKCRKWESEFSSGRSRSDAYARRDRTLDKYGRGDGERSELVPWRGGRDEIEKGEFIPDRWHRKDYFRNDHYYPKPRRHGSSRERDWRNEHGWTPSPCKYSGEVVSPDKEYCRSGNPHFKRSVRWEADQERNYPKSSSKIVDLVSPYKVDYGRSKSYGRELSSGSRLKRHSTDSDSRDRRCYDDHGDYYSSKSRKVSGDSVRPAHPENTSRRSMDREHRISSTSGINAEKNPARRYDISVSRSVYDKYGRSPSHCDRSPHERSKYRDHRDRTPVRRERSPHDRGHLHNHNDHRGRSPSYAERSPQHHRCRPQDRRDKSPSYLEKSPREQSKHSNDLEIRGNETNGKRQSKKTEGEMLSERRELDRRESTASVKGSNNENNMPNGSIDRSVTHHTQKEDTAQSPCLELKEPPFQDNGLAEEAPSMEEDMDICDTPPLVPAVADAELDSGKWYYLDHLGLERGPSRLCELKALVEGGMLMSDHLVKHIDSDRWVAVENAASPLLTVNYSAVVSDIITQLANPPEAPGNLLADAGDSEQHGIQICQETSDWSAQSASCREVSSGSADIMEDLRIDERVGAMLEGVTVVPGKELETVREILQMSFEHAQWERWSNSEGVSWQQPLTRQASEQNRDAGNVSDCLDNTSKDVECTTSKSFDNDCDPDEFNGWFSGYWSCKGGDWRRNDEAIQDKSLRKKCVLNEGYPLCQLPKSRYEDPRLHRKDDLHCSLQSTRLELPPWAFSWPDGKIDGNTISITGQSMPIATRGVKGIMLPVVRINACVVKDNDSFVSDPRPRSRGKDKYSMKSARPSPSPNEVKKLPGEDAFRSKIGNKQEPECEAQVLEAPGKSPSICVPKDRLSTVDELQLHLGGWYFLDGAGHERGPLSYSELQVLVGQGLIQNGSSVFRKIDNVWVPVKSAADASLGGLKLRGDLNAPIADCSRASLLPVESDKLVESSEFCSSFHRLHPQFIGYTRGKLHELVMKAYRRREFAAAINEVLDPWINAKQPRREMERHLNASVIQSSYLSKLAINNEGSLLHEDQRFARKRAKLSDGSEGEHAIQDEFLSLSNDEPSFDDLCVDATFHWEDVDYSEVTVSKWGILDGHILARIFHFLRADLKSLLFGSSTCKQWRAAAGFYKGICRQVDLSSIGSSCSDSAVKSIMSGYDEGRIRSIVLVGCSSISCPVLEDILNSFSHISTVDIRGCTQFETLTGKFPHVNWIRSQRMQPTDSNFKLKSLNQIIDMSSLVSMTGLGSCVDDSNGLKDYFDMVDKRGASSQSFRQSLYKRNKINGIRNSASILSKNPRIRRWAMKKPGYWYKRMEQFLLSSLKDIMKENNFDIFVPKVAEIEDRIRSGYYAGHGLSSVKDDINKMCQDAVKTKNRGDVGDMNRMITQFIRLATRLEDTPKTNIDICKDFSGNLKHKKLSKMDKETKNAFRSNGGPYVNGVSDNASAFGRRLSRSDRRSMGPGSESSDEFEFSDGSRSPSESAASDTESDLDIRLERSAADPRDGYCAAEDGSDFMSDDREWGARMTKASLVPPVTRSYDVISEYLIVADEDEVRRKMWASLPDDYDEKVKAQKMGTEEMDIPEVKEFKPRKQLGDEVIEQEVYGIDPYTHNLLLDSMPGDEDWSLREKHLFIEDVLLRTLNMQVRHFTGAGNTPMMYPLKNVIREILETAKDNGNTRTLKMCEALLDAIGTRTEDNYVAYRKGLGVVCNKEGGFGEEDFVVEFLGEVYPAWKWFEKQDGIRSLQKNNEDPAPEFYNIYLERPKGDADGYDLVVVDAMHKANYASRICHSCQPNCEAKVTAVDGQYQIGIYSVRPIGFGEEITFDYNSVTESKEEYEASVCLCGSHICRGSYLNLTGEGAFLKVLKQFHGLLDRHLLLLEACELNWVSEDDYIVLSKAGLGSCLLGGLPDWLIAYSARLVRFISFERTKLPEVILRHNLEEKRKYFAHICMEDERSDAEIQAEGVCNQRIQNLALTLDKVRYVMRCVFGDPKKAPPPLQRLSPEEMVAFLWKGEGSLVKELLDCIAPHVDNSVLVHLRSNIKAHDPSCSNDILKELKNSLLWLRDEVRNLPCTYKCRHDAAADLIHIYAHTKQFFKIREYKSVTSPPVHISPLDLGPKYADKLSGLTEYRKTYGENYCLGQLINWFNQTSADPDRALATSSRGCLSLPEIGSFYAKPQKPSRQRVYGPMTVKAMLSLMEKHPQRSWPTDKIWSFKSSVKFFGSPMLDAVLNKSKSLERDMVVWLKNRPSRFQATWDH